MGLTAWIAGAVLLLGLSSYCYAADSRSTDGTFFVIGFPPTKLETRTAGRIQLIINTKAERANVLVRNGPTTSNSYTVLRGTTLRVGVSTQRRPTEGLENAKGFFVESDFDISLRVLNEAEDSFADVAVAQPIREDCVEFIINSATTSNFGDCGNDPARVFSFIEVVAQDQDTLVNVFNQNDEIIDSFSIDPYQGYTLRQTFQERNTGYDGYRVAANKPVTVMTGNACFSAGEATVASPTFDYVPPIARLGRTHILPAPESPLSNAQDHIVQVVAVEDTILQVRFEADEILLTRGQTYRRNFNADQSATILCSVPCSVTQTTWNYGPSFLAHVPPVELYNNDVIFDFPSITAGLDLVHRLTIATTSASLDSFYLNGSPLDNLAWDCGSDDLLFYCFTVLDIPRENLELYTIPDTVNFTAVVVSYFANTGEAFEGKGYGHQLGAIAQPIEAPPQPDPNTTISDGQPEYTVSHNAAFNTMLENETFPFGCDAVYQASLQQKASELEDLVNVLARNGTICQVPSIFGPVGLLNTTAITVTAVEDEVSGSTRLVWRVQGASTLNMAQIEDCGADIDDYLAPYLNWGQDSIMPPDCPDVVFQGDAFNQLGREWDCDVQSLTRATPSKMTDVLKMNLFLEGEFFTTNNLPINATCGQYYAETFDDAAIQVTAAAAQLLANASLCNGRFVEIESVASGISVDQNIAATEQSIFLNPTETLPFYQIQNCVEEISNYIELQSNWANPIIPREPTRTCPPVAFRATSFLETSRDWVCLNSELDSDVAALKTFKGQRRHRIQTKQPTPLEEKPEAVFHQSEAFVERVKAKKRAEEKTGRKSSKHHEQLKGKKKFQKQLLKKKGGKNQKHNAHKKQ